MEEPSSSFFIPQGNPTYQKVYRPKKVDRRNIVYLLLNYSQEKIFLKGCYTHACKCAHVHVCVCVCVYYMSAYNKNLKCFPHLFCVFVKLVGYCDFL
jgi:hypothetical protein